MKIFGGFHLLLVLVKGSTLITKVACLHRCRIWEKLLIKSAVSYKSYIYCVVLCNSDFQSPVDSEAPICASLDSECPKDEMYSSPKKSIK